MSNMPDVTIQKMTAANIGSYSSFPSEYDSDAQLVFRIEDGKIMHHSESCSFAKTFEEHELDINEYIDSADKVVFLAYSDNEVVGQIQLSKSWNKYAYIEDVRVRRRYRRAGVGIKLMNAARDWAEENGLIGLSLEAQNKNANAIRFYERYGFIIGGVNYCLYRAFPESAGQVAVYMYYLFAEEQDGQ